MVPAMTIYKHFSLKELLHKEVLFHNHKKGHGKNELTVSQDCARVLQMN